MKAEITQISITPKDVTYICECDDGWMVSWVAERVHASDDVPPRLINRLETIVGSVAEVPR